MTKQHRLKIFLLGGILAVAVAATGAVRAPGVTASAIERAAAFAQEGYEATHVICVGVRHGHTFGADAFTDLAPEDLAGVRAALGHRVVPVSACTFAADSADTALTVVRERESGAAALVSWVSAPFGRFTLTLGYYGGDAVLASWRCLRIPGFGGRIIVGCGLTTVA